MDVIQLRPYQLDCLDAVVKFGVGRGIINIPTGCGKSVIAARIPERTGAKKVLLLAHREELIEQLEHHVKMALPDAWVGVEQAGREAKPMDDIVVASIPTLAARGYRRLERLQPERFDAVIYDEVHHCLADTSLGVLGRLGFLTDQGTPEKPKWVKVGAPRIPLYGQTATVGRGDGVGLYNVFDRIIYQLKLQDAIKGGWLVPICPWSVYTNVNLDNVRTVAGEYVEKDLAREVDTRERNAAVFDACRERADGLKTLIFCVTVKHAEDMAAHFVENGRGARFISGAMDSTTRSDNLEWFKKTPGAVLSNVAVLSEGTDIPSIECVCNAAPTRSKTRFAQALGRGTRLAEGSHDYSDSLRLGKERLVFLDVTDTTSRIGAQAVNMADIWGLPLRDKKLDGAPLEEEEEDQNKLIEDQDAKKVKTVSKSVNIFAPPPTGAIPSSAKFAWTYLSETEMRLMLPQHEQIRMVTNTLDQWCLEWLDGLKWTQSDQPFNDKAAAFKAAEAHVQMMRPDAIRLLAWQNCSSKKPPSPKQIEYAKRLKIEVPEGCTAVELSKAMNAVISTQDNKPTAKMVWLARRLGIESPETMTKAALGRAIGKAKADQEAEVEVLDESSCPF